MPTGPFLPDPQLLDRYLAGECSDIERRTIEAWLRDHADDAVRAGLISYAARYPLEGLRGRKAAAYDAFLAMTRSAEVAERSTPRIDRVAGRPRRPLEPRWAGRRQSSVRTFLAAAAVLAMVGGASWVVTRGRGQKTPDRTAAVAWKSFKAAHAQRAIVRLADGTRVTLAPESELRVRQAPEGAPAEVLREVELTGEGFFEVAHVDGRPFVIHTADGTITQLGTSFDVRSYPKERATQIVVTEGRVGLRPNVASPKGTAPRGAVVLAAGDFARMTSGGVANVARSVDVSQYTGWMNGELRYDNAPLARVVEDLERWYDVKIELADSAFATYQLTATLRQGSVNDVMDVVVKSLDLRAKRRGNTVWIVAKHAQPPERK